MYLNHDNSCVVGDLRALHSQQNGNWRRPSCKLVQRAAAMSTPAWLSATPAPTATSTVWQVLPAAEANSWVAVANSPTSDRFVAVASDGTNRLMTSVDGGATWTAKLAAQPNSWKGIASAHSAGFGNEQRTLWVAVSSDGADRVMVGDADANAWSAMTMSGSLNALPWSAVAGGGGYFFAVSNSGAWMTASPMPLSHSSSISLWQAIPLSMHPSLRRRTGGLTSNGGTTASWTACAYGEWGAKKVFVTVAYAQSDTAYAAGRLVGILPVSTPWSAGTIIGGTITVGAESRNQWQDVAFGAGIFVAVSHDGVKRVMFSPDLGTNWVAASAAEAHPWKAITYGNGFFVAVAVAGTNRAMMSMTGEFWSILDGAGANAWTSIAFAFTATGPRFVAVANSGTGNLRTMTGSPPPSTPVPTTPPNPSPCPALETPPQNGGAGTCSGATPPQGGCQIQCDDGYAPSIANGAYVCDGIQYSPGAGTILCEALSTPPPTMPPPPPPPSNDGMILVGIFLLLCIALGSFVWTRPRNDVFGDGKDGTVGSAVMAKLGFGDEEDGDKEDGGEDDGGDEYGDDEESGDEESGKTRGRGKKKKQKDDDGDDEEEKPQDKKRAKRRGKKKGRNGKVPKGVDVNEDGMMMASI